MPQPTWITPAGNLGTYTEGLPISITFIATASSGSYALQYDVLNGVFPDAIIPFALDQSTGILTGTPSQVAVTTNFPFTIRVSEYDGTTFKGSTDRTFSFDITGVSPPTFLTPAGPLYPAPYYLPDCTWDPVQISVDNPDPDTVAIVRLANGTLPPGLEINEAGIIRGYADPSNNNYQFTLSVTSGSGSATRDFEIQVVQQTTGTRRPAILNTRPPSYTIGEDDPNAPYYIDSAGNIGILAQDNYFIFRILGESFDSGSLSYTRIGSLPPGVTDNVNYSSTNLDINIVTPGTGYAPGDALKILGSAVGGVDGINDIYFNVNTVDAGGLESIISISGLNVDSNEFYNAILVQTVTGTGAGAVVNLAKINPSWILGTITNNPSLLVATYNFSYVATNNNNALGSVPISFSATVVAQSGGVPFDTSIVWETNEDLGVIYNGGISTFFVSAVQVGGLDLTYTLASGTLPPDLSITTDGEIQGRVAFETQASITPIGTTIDYTFTITAQNALYPSITSTKLFKITVLQKFDQPYDNLYIKALLPISRRMILNSLLQDTYLIPTEYLYRPDDIYFGKSKEIIYQHMYGVPSSSVSTFITAVERNHYRRNIILGPIKTAKAKDGSGNTLYEVVYSEIVDDLVNNDGVSISKEIIWPVPIEGSSRILYPNSLPNMRQQIADFIGYDTQSALLPAWMSTQQDDGQILGFVPVWVICYTKPGYSEIIKNNIISPIPGPVNVSASYATNNFFDCTSTVGFYVGMKIKFSGTAFGGVTTGVQYYINTIESDTQFTITTAIGTGPVSLSNATGEMQLEHVVWDHTLNEFDFRIDRFEVGKSLTFEYNPTTESWTVLPTSINPTNSDDEYIYFNKNILGNS